jgi:hypothetical protein
VRFASSDAESALDASSAPALIVTEQGFGGDGGAHMVSQLEALFGRSLPALVLDYGAEGSLGDVRTQVSFVTDEALGAKPDQRRSRRILYSTICTFREGALVHPVYGLTHDISREGLYVRTLDPPAAGTSLWLELRTSEGVAVHLRGRVMWRRDADMAGAAALAGFGFQIDETSTPAHDLGLWNAAYNNSSTVA